MNARHDPPEAETDALDRAADERADPALLQNARDEPATRVLVLRGDQAPLAAEGRLLWVTPSLVPEGAEWAFLGRDAAGRALLSAVLPADGPEPFTADAGWAGLRVVGAELSATESAAFVAALSLGRWLREAPHCPACGSLTLVRHAGWSRSCPACGREHFPRTDPAVIVAVCSARHPDRLLLGSNALWGADRYSCFAGFVEAGESLEGAVMREVREEAGVDLVDVRFHGSQAWPYPRSLMVGFLATAARDEDAQPDGEEIVSVRWFSRDEIGAALEGGGGIILPGRSSISRRLIEAWHAGAA